MNLTKYPQSCILVESGGTKILIDPSTVQYDEKFLKIWKTADAVLVTHRHSDHIYAEILKDFKVLIYSTAEVQKFYPNLKIKVIKEKDIFNIGKLNVQVVKAIHGFIAADGEVLENVGFIVDDGKTKLYVTSDTIRYNGIEKNKADVLFADVTAFDASMNLWGAGQTLKEVGARLLVVAHQEGGRMLYEKAQIEKYLTEQGIKFVIPSVGDTLDI